MIWIVKKKKVDMNVIWDRIEGTTRRAVVEVMTPMRMSRSVRVMTLIVIAMTIVIVGMKAVAWMMKIAMMKVAKMRVAMSLVAIAKTIEDTRNAGDARTSIVVTRRARGRINHVPFMVRSIGIAGQVASSTLFTMVLIHKPRRNSTNMISLTTWIGTVMYINEMLLTKGTTQIIKDTMTIIKVTIKDTKISIEDTIKTNKAVTINSTIIISTSMVNIKIKICQDVIHATSSIIMVPQVTRCWTLHY